MIFALGLACAPDAPLQPAARLSPVRATEASVVEVPAAPAGCVNTVRIQVPFERCAHVALEAMAPDSVWQRAEGALSGVEGECLLMCAPSEASAQWLFKLDPPGWVGDATCVVPAAGSMHIHASAYAVGDRIDDAVGALWLQEGATSYGIAPLQLPDGSEGRGITTNGCTAGQPRRTVAG